MVQGHEVDEHQRHQEQRQGHYMQGEEAVEGDFRHQEVPANPLHQAGAEEGNGAEQGDDHLRPPVGHVAPRQQVAEEALRHQHQVDGHADEPEQFPGLAVGAVQQPAEDVQIDDDEERRSAGGVQIAQQPAELDIAHDVLDRGEGALPAGDVAHRQPDAGDQLIDQHEGRQPAHQVPEVVVLRRVVLGQVVFPSLRHREPVVEPAHKRPPDSGNPALCLLHQAVSSSSPMMTTEAEMKRCGGTSRLSGAGTAVTTRPAKSKREPWQGQKKPPCQSWSKGSGRTLP